MSRCAVALSLANGSTEMSTILEAPNARRHRLAPLALLLVQAVGCTGSIAEGGRTDVDDDVYDNGESYEVASRVVEGVDDDGDGLIANPDRYEVKPGETTQIPAARGVLSNDGGPGALRARLVSAPASGRLWLRANGSFVYVAPASAAPGSSVSFRYRLLDRRGNRDESTVTLTLAPASTDPAPDVEPAPQVEPVEPGGPSARGAVFFGPENPVVYVNDQPNDVYVDGYLMALAANREIALRGIVSSGVDCGCDAGDNYPRTGTPNLRGAWIHAAREAGFQNIPDGVNGTQGPRLARPASGKIGDTARIGSPGTDLLVREARRATAERPLLIVAAAPLTTVADAYLADPSIAQRAVVSWLGGSGQHLDDWNAHADPWAAEIVLRNFRSFVFPVDLDPPHVSEARMLRELPDTRLRELLVGAGYYRPDYDSDGQPAVTIMLPSFVRAHRRASFADGMRLVDDPNGRVLVMTRGDSEAGGNEFFRALRKAFAGQ